MKWPWKSRQQEPTEPERFMPSPNLNIYHVRPEDITVTRTSLIDGVSISIGDYVTIFLDRDAGRNDTTAMAKEIGARIADPSTWRVL